MEERIRQVNSEKEKAEEGIEIFHDQLRRSGEDVEVQKERRDKEEKKERNKRKMEKKRRYCLL